MKVFDVFSPLFHSQPILGQLLRKDIPAKHPRASYTVLVVLMGILALTPTTAQAAWCRVIKCLNDPAQSCVPDDARKFCSTEVGLPNCCDPSIKDSCGSCGESEPEPPGSNPTATSTPTATATPANDGPRPPATATVTIPPEPSSTHTPFPEGSHTPVNTSHHTPISTPPGVGARCCELYDPEYDLGGREECCKEAFPNWVSGMPCDTRMNCPLASHTATSTPASNEPRPIATETATIPSEPSSTNTPIPEATYTYTATSTATPRATSTSVPQATATHTATYTYTAIATATSTPMATSTYTPRATAQPTASLTPVATATHASTSTPNATATVSHTATASHSATASHTPTPTFTAAVPLATSTPEPTASATATVEATATSSGALITLSADCRQRNSDGSFTSYFSYNNTSGVELSIEDDPALDTINRLESNNDLLTPPSQFKTGVSLGAVIIPHLAESITWTVKAGGANASSATSSPNTPLCQVVEPLASCQSNGVVLLGYNNPNQFAIVVPQGPDNFFSSGVSKANAIETFLPGRVESVLSAGISATSGQNSWTLQQQSLNLDKTMTSCQKEEATCVNINSEEVLGNLDQVALELSAIAQRTAFALQKAKRRAIDRKSRSRKVNAQSLSRIEIERRRAVTRAKELEATAYRLTIDIPKVSKVCLDAPGYCKSVDRFDTFIQLRRLYAYLLNMTKRQTNRFHFIELGQTKRNRAAVVKAKKLVKFGHSELDKLPRIATDCT